MLRLERNAWSLVKLLRQATNEPSPPSPPAPVPEGATGCQDADEPLQEFRRCLARLKPHKTLSNLRAWKRALDNVKATRNVHSRANITLTLNGDPKQGIQPIVAGCPMSTTNR